MRAQSYNRSIRLQSLPLHVTDRVCTMTRYTPRAERADSISSISAWVRSWRFPSESRMTEGFTFSKNTNSISQYGTHRFTVRSYRGGPSRGRGPCARTRDFAFWILIFPARIVRIDISIIEFLAMVIRTEPGTAPGMVTTHQSFEVRCVVHSQWLYFTRRTQDTTGTR